MTKFGAALAVGLALATISAWCVLLGVSSSNSTGTVDHVVYLQGSVLRIPGTGTTEFSVPAPGGYLVGSIGWDHTSASAMVVPLGAHVLCPSGPSGYSGAPWTQYVNTTLPVGSYEFGALCGGFGNGTVTQTIEVIFP